MQALLGQKLSGEINLVAQTLILIGLWVGFYFARKKQFARHRIMQTSMVSINSFFILFVMVTSFYSNVIRGGATSILVEGLMIIHGTIGLLAELTGIYLILLMNTSLLPPGLRVKNYRLVMRSLLGLWSLIVIGGFGIFYTLYLAPVPTTGSIPAAQLMQAAKDLQMHAGEMQSALQRGSLSTARRHAEHLINLVEGKGGPDYGDADGDGTVEDPGNGTGALVFLDNALAASTQPASNRAQASQMAGQIRSDMLKVIEDAKAVIAGDDLPSVANQINEAVTLMEQINKAQTGSVAQLLQTLNLNASASTISGTLAPSGGRLW